MGLLHLCGTHAIFLAAAFFLSTTGTIAQSTCPPGAPPGSPGCPFPPNNNPPCGTDASAAVVTYSTTSTLRTLNSNGCPPYDWTDQKSPGPTNGTFAVARQNPLTMTIPRRPTIQASISNAVSLTTVKGPVGQTLLGPPIFSAFDILGRDALQFEGATFDHCGGHVAPGPDQYHYHSTPGDVNPTGHSSTRNLDFQICPELTWWIQPWRTFWHAPLLGVMADGVPLYGPRGDWGQAPQGLDQCSGHTDKTHPYYHYHTTSNFPYVVNCLRGCMDPSIPRGRNWNGVNLPACTPAQSQYDYSWLDLELPWRLNRADNFVNDGNRKMRL